MQSYKQEATYYLSIGKATPWPTPWPSGKQADTS